MGPILFAAGALGFGLLGATVDRVEKAAADDIRSRLSGPAAEVFVTAIPNGLAGAWGDVSEVEVTARQFDVDGLPFFVEPERSRAGRIGTLRLNLQQFRIRGLDVQSLSAEIPGCRYDFRQALGMKSFRLSRSGEGTGEVVVSESALADFILRKFPEIRSASVKVDRDVLWVEGEGDFLLVRTEFAVIAKVRVVDGVALHLADEKVYFDWQRASPEAARAVVSALNPVVDLNRDLGLHGAMHVESVSLRDGLLVARGRARVPTLPVGDR